MTEGADVGDLGVGDLEIDFEGDIALDSTDLPQELDVAELWKETRGRIESYIAEHGHSDVPRDYYDQNGRLGGLVGSIRWFVAGKGGLSLGPFPGIDLVAELEEVEGWVWDP